MKTFKQTLMIMLSMLFCSCFNGSSDAVAQSASAQTMYITIDGVSRPATLVTNAATQALVQRLQQGAITVTLNSSGGFEIWGALGFSLPTSNQQITAQPGDVILYNGSNICLFYGSNSWSYTRLGHIDGLTEAELRSFLKAGESNISVTLSLQPVKTAISQVNADRGGESDTYFNLSGQKVENPSGGIFIKNGKKIKL